MQPNDDDDGDDDSLMQPNELLKSNPADCVA